MKKNYKFIIGLVCGILVSATGVYAAETIIESINVSYDNKTSGGSYNNVQEAIDELYEKSGILKTKWVDPTLNGADPVLEVEGSTKKLIPVTIDNDGTVHYANLKTKWYDYSDKRWANAVILVDNPKNGGDEKYTYKTGDIIKEEDIESYFVWIPRYSYKIWNMANTDETTEIVNGNDITNANKNLYKLHGNAKIIEIKFGDTKENPKMAESTASLNNYYTHPAFTLGNKDLNGFWIGKFETGYNQNDDNGNPIEDTLNWTINEAKIDNINSKRIIIKPNVFSWRSNPVRKIFMSAYDYARELDSHMIKNTEWGAVAYLSHSMYGIGTEVRINNNSKTGYSAAPHTDQSVYPGDYGSESDGYNLPYNSLIGYLASTTGNITGVYDMSGNTSEAVAAYYANSVGESEFDINELTTTYKDYFDVYPENSTFKNRILGDATGEMGPFYRYYIKDSSAIVNGWYSDASGFISSTSPWFRRGGYISNGIVGSQFACSSFNGQGAGSNIGSRLVLATK